LLPAAVHSDEREYHFEAYVSSMFLSGTVDEIFFRLCGESECGLFQAVPAGWQSTGTSYSYSYSTRKDLGEIHRVQIVHPGSDALCIGHIIVDGVEYDENEHRWIDWPHCIEETDGGGCDTVTIVLAGNDWNSALTVPCEHDDDLEATYSPTAAPSIEPTPSPTPIPTARPSRMPSEGPIVAPPTASPSNAAPSETTETTTTSTSGGDLAANFVAGGARYDHSMIVGAVIGAASAFVLCLCFTVFLAIFCWKKRSRVEQGVKVMQCASHDVDEEEPVIVMAEGVAARSGTMDTGSSYNAIGSTPCSAAFDEGDDAVAVDVVEDVALLMANDQSSEDGDGNTRRETLDLSRSLDEDILPKDESDGIEAEWVE